MSKFLKIYEAVFVLVALLEDCCSEMLDLTRKATTLYVLL